MARRGHGEGTISQLADGRWQGRVRYTEPLSGKKARKAVYGKTQKEAREKLKQFSRKLEDGFAPSKGKMTFGEWIDQWLEQHVKRQKRITTWENYDVLARLHIKPKIGQIKLGALKSADLQNLYNQKIDSGRVDNKGGLSSKTVGLIHLVCHLALKQAVRESLIARNVADATTVPSKQKKEIVPMNEAEIKQFLTVNRQDRLFAAFYLLISTGLRRGELLGLKWSDIDMEAKTLHIQRSLVKTITEKAKFHPPKTLKSMRLVHLTDEVMEELMRHKARQDEEKAELETAYNDEQMVFCRKDGVPLYPDVLYNRFHELLDRAQLSHFRIHDLRHTFATIMLKQDVHAKVVQEILGHSNVGVTLDTYSHVLPGIKEQAMCKMKSVLTMEDSVIEVAADKENADAQSDAQNGLQQGDMV